MLDKAWITPEWGYVSAEAAEHTRLALCRMLYGRQTCDLPADWIYRWSAWPKRDLDKLKKMGVAANVIKFLGGENADPRIFVAREYGWVRVFVETRDQGFMFWEWSPVTLALIQSASSDWLRFVNRKESVTLEALHPHAAWSVPIKRLLSQTATSETLGPRLQHSESSLAQQFHESVTANPQPDTDEVGVVAETIAGKIAAKVRDAGVVSYDEVYEMTKALLRGCKTYQSHSALYPLVIALLRNRKVHVVET